jgi:trans-aconitate methyltransferase
VGRLVGRAMVRGNAAFNRWVIETVAPRVGTDLVRIVDLGCGPGVGLEMLLLVFPDAQVWGVDRSSVMIAQAQRRNQRALESGRLRLVEGDVGALSQLSPVDLVVAVHLLYFWRQPGAELARIRASLRPGGNFAIGYRLRKDMPGVSQRQFPAEGHRLYDSDQEVVALFREAGFEDIQHTSQQPAPGQGSAGRLVIGTA